MIPSGWYHSLTISFWYADSSCRKLKLCIWQRDIAQRFFLMQHFVVLSLMLNVCRCISLSNLCWSWSERTSWGMFFLFEDMIGTNVLSWRPLMRCGGFSLDSAWHQFWWLRACWGILRERRKEKEIFYHICWSKWKTCGTDIYTKSLHRKSDLKATYLGKIGRKYIVFAPESLVNNLSHLSFPDRKSRNTISFLKQWFLHIWRILHWQ